MRLSPHTGRYLLWGAALLAALVLAAISVPSATARRSKMEAAPKAERLFSHARHAVTVRVACDRCHEATEDGLWTKSGKKEHARCFSCHKFSSSCSVLAAKEGRVCLNCHTNFKAECVPAAYVKPEVGVGEFSATYSHRLHIRPRAKTGRQCENCHGEFGASSPKTGSLASGHALCSGCHARGVSPRIKESCDGCHLDRATNKPAVIAPSKPNPFSVGKSFDHKAHAQLGRVGTEGRACLTCHSNIKDAPSDTTIPMPTMKGCQETCHDGDKAFNAIGTTCTRCHSEGAN